MSLQKIETKIYEIRGVKVMLDYDLAELYEVATKSLNLSVKRNIKRFPDDFMFQLTNIEWERLRFQFETLKTGRGRHSKYLPYAFTEQGLAMLSGILNSDKAVQVNIAIMRAFVFMRQYALTHKDLTEKLKALENQYNQQFKDIYEAIEYLLNKDKKQTEQTERKIIGYKS
jgi:phage regulator Rha-like protein